MIAGVGNLYKGAFGIEGLCFCWGFGLWMMGFLATIKWKRKVQNDSWSGKLV